MSGNKSYSRILILSLIVLQWPIIASASDNINSIRDIRVNSEKSFTRIVIECDREFMYSQNLIKLPDRLYFDLQGIEPSKFNQADIQVNDQLVNDVKVGRNSDDITRVVIGLKKYEDFNVYALEDPARLVIEINSPVTAEEFIPRSRIVVIDPGHGGKDPGAIGRHGLMEKDVTLSIAKELKKVLESRYSVKVFLTREDDRYLELKERTNFANSHNADLFVSIHVNASPDRRTKGLETWFLNFPSTEYDQRIAARENAISVERMKQSQTEVGSILASLERGLKRDESLRLASYIQNSMVRNLDMRYKNRIEDHGIKFTLFYVLVDAEMPSALVETGFITNPDEEKMLRKPSYRKDLALSVAKGINSYLSTLPDLPKMARR